MFHELHLGDHVNTNRAYVLLPHTHVDGAHPLFIQRVLDFKGRAGVGGRMRSCCRGRALARKVAVFEDTRGNPEEIREERLAFPAGSSLIRCNIFFISCGVGKAPFPEHMG